MEVCMVSIYIIGGLPSFLSASASNISDAFIIKIKMWPGCDHLSVMA